MNPRIIPITLACSGLLVAGCATTNSSSIASSHTLPYSELHFPPPMRGVQPVIVGSINGVSGHFVLDTGAMTPILTQTAVKRCGIITAPSLGFAAGVGGRIAMLQATNVTVNLAQGCSLHWATVLVLPPEAANPAGTNGEIFGLLDYNTLTASHAVVDMDHKTITLTK